MASTTSSASAPGASSACSVSISIRAPPSIASVLSTAVPGELQTAFVCGGPALTSFLFDAIDGTPPQWILDLPPEVFNYLASMGLVAMNPTPPPTGSSTGTGGAISSSSASRDTMTSPTATTAVAGSTAPSPLSQPGVIAGLAVGMGACLCIIVAGAFYVVRKRKFFASTRKRRVRVEDVTGGEETGLDDLPGDDGLILRRTARPYQNSLESLQPKHHVH
ncbi:hypothetical protein QBC34DRAFT_102135 [Podospora aff. communis PSN243]|uniref:Mid2 domain-containing protein n=1 Tax=Podospora aff. communis PSN243 TaxID=3040156 RepID=A0AAV9GLB5_9PEZI|nr:hypothetical protein QBC34DRAFT_102135 [Podospora aff. communis PSN243]